MISRWQRFLDSLNTAGGHIFILAVFTICGVVLLHFSFPKADDLYVGSFAALLLYLKMKGE